MRFFATLASGLLALGALAAATPTPDHHYGGGHGCRHWNYNNRQSVSREDYNRHWKHQSNVQFVSQHGNTVIIIIVICDDDDHHHKRSAEPEAAAVAAPEAAAVAAPEAAAVAAPEAAPDNHNDRRCKHFSRQRKTVSRSEYNRRYRNQSNVHVVSERGNVIIIIIIICDDDQHHHKRSAAPEAARDNRNNDNRNNDNRNNDHRNDDHRNDDHRNDHHDNDRHDNDHHDNDHDNDHHDNDRHRQCSHWNRSYRNVSQYEYDHYWQYQSNVSVQSRHRDFIVIIIIVCDRF